MKVYRVVPEVAGSNSVDWLAQSDDSLESLYYSLGYMCFNGTISRFLRRCDEEGRHFFIFLEDAIYFMSLNLHICDTWKLMVFDFPEEDVYSLIYSQEYPSYNRPEIYMKKSMISGKRISSEKITQTAKERILISDYRKSYATEIEFKKRNIPIQRCWDKPSEEVYASLLKYLRENFGEKFSDVNSLSNKDIRSIIDERSADLNENTIWRFFNETQELIKTPAITGQSAILLYEWAQSSKLNPALQAYNIETLVKCGFNPDYSKEGIALRRDYARLIDEGQHERAKKYLKSYQQQN